MRRRIGRLLLVITGLGLATTGCDGDTTPDQPLANETIVQEQIQNESIVPELTTPDPETPLPAPPPDVVEPPPPEKTPPPDQEPAPALTPAPDLPPPLAAVSWEPCPDSTPPDNQTIDPLALPAPHFRLDFESPQELANLGASFKPADISSADGRSGRAMRIPTGFLGLPFAKVIHPEQGTLGFWIRSDAWHPRREGTVFLLNTDNPVVTGGATGADFSLRLYWPTMLGPDGQPLLDSHGAPRKSDPLLGFYAAGRNAATEVAPITLPTRDWGAGEWHHVAISWVPYGTGHRFRLYLDGHLGGETTAAVPLGYHPTPKFLYLLSTDRAGWKTAFPGAFQADVLRSYDTALSPAQIRQLYHAAITPGVTMAGDRLQLQLTSAADGYGIYRMFDHGINDRSVTLPAAPRQLWQLEFQAGPQPDDLRYTISNLGAGVGQMTCQISPDQHAVQLRWTDLPLPGADGGIATPAGTADVTATFTSAGSGVTGQLAVDTHTAAGSLWTLHEVIFPRVAGIAPIGNAADNELVLTGTSLGSLQRDPFTQPRLVLAAAKTQTPGPVWSWQSVYPSSDLPMPWWGLYNRTTLQSGLYVGMHDPDARIKTFHFHHQLAPQLATLWKTASGQATAKQWLADPALHGYGVDVRHPVAQAGEEAGTYHPTWMAVFDVIDGDWYPLAQRYRQFVTGNNRPAWTGAGPLAQRKDLPAWMADAGVLQSSTTFATVQQLQSALPVGSVSGKGLPLWHYTAWQDNSGQQINDMPVSSSLNSTFVANLQAASAAKIPVALYFWPGAKDLLAEHGTNWSNIWDTQVAQSLATWQSAADGAAAGLRDAQGNLLGGDYAPLGTPAGATIPPRHHAQMCPAAEPWQQTIVQAHTAILQQSAKIAAPNPVKGFYEDVIARGLPHICYATDHGHAPGDATAHVHGYRAMLQRLRTLQPQIGYYTEGFADPYLDLIDGFLVEYQPWWERTVPIASAVYHDYTQFLGRNIWGTSHTLDIMTAWQSEMLLMGGMPGYGNVINTAGSADQAIRAHLMRLATVRRAAKEFLVLGTMLAPPELRELATTPENMATKIAIVRPGTGTNQKTVTVRNLPIYTHPAASCATGLACTDTLPVVLASAWRAPSQQVGIALASTELISADPAAIARTVSLPLAAVAQTLGRSPSAVIVKDGTATSTVSFGSATHLAITLPRQAVVVLEFL